MGRTVDSARAGSFEDDQEAKLARRAGDGFAQARHGGGGGGRSTFAVMLLTLASRLLGIVRIRVFGSIFGASGVADAINFSFNIPNNFRKLFSEGALSSALVPEFSRLSADKDRSCRLFSSFLGLQLLISGFILAAVIFLKRPIVLLLSDFSDPAQTALAAALLPFFALFFVFILLSSFFSSILQSRLCFAVQAMAPLLFSVMVILSLLFAEKSLGPYAMALGAVSGGLLQMLCTGGRLRLLGFRMRPSLDFRFADFNAALDKWGPALCSSAASIVSTQAAFLFASGMGEGAVTSFANSLIFWQTPYGIFFTAVATVLLPLMGRSGGTKLAALYSDGLKRLLSFLVPCAVFLFIFRAQAVAVVLQTGRFGVNDSLRTGKVLGIFLIGMPLAALFEFTKRLAYCLGLQKTVLRTSVGVCALDIIATILLIKCGLDVASLPAASLVSNLAGLLALGVAAKGRLEGFKAGNIAAHLLKAILACLPMALWAILARTKGPDLLAAGSTLEGLGFFCGAAGSGALLVLGAYRLAGIRLFRPQT